MGWCVGRPRGSREDVILGVLSEEVGSNDEDDDDEPNLPPENSHSAYRAWIGSLCVASKGKRRSVAVGLAAVSRHVPSFPSIVPISVPSIESGLPPGTPSGLCAGVRVHGPRWGRGGNGWIVLPLKREFDRSVRHSPPFASNYLF